MILVFGSLNWDTMVCAPRLPALDETLPGQGAAWRFGGKGGNQAVAAARCGARVAMAGAVGRDDAGRQLLAALDRAGVDRVGVACVAGASGMSVAIDTDAGYGAVVVAGANLHARAADVPPGIRVALIQNEVPEAANRALARMLPRDVTLIWNAAPARKVDAALLARVDILVVNRVEAAQMGEAARAVPLLIETLGEGGCRMRDATGSRHFPAPAVTVASTHGAGDAFCGALAAALDAGAAPEKAVARAQDHAARTVATPHDAR
ncbi:PfkB family carbohydrate kinase [Jannaschia rubra]|uniref:PfkB family carbohydrate kinase n=1 Tax=Jannaschia rubra TaxID=282197 RepID=UPI0024927597|nr:PfkB family carbohydrate kinase [Jannaschia rubra]